MCDVEPRACVSKSSGLILDCYERQRKSLNQILHRSYVLFSKDSNHPTATFVWTFVWLQNIIYKQIRSIKVIDKTLMYCPLPFFYH